MITLVIVGILLAVGIPSLKTFMQSNQLVASTNEVVSALHIARSEAIKLNKRVTVCVSKNGKTCLNNSNKWHKGWIVFIDANDDRVGTGLACKKLADINSDCLLRAQAPVNDAELSITGKYDSSNQAIKWITFTSRGLPKNGGASQSGIFSVCSFDNSNVVGSRAVVLSLSGRMRVSDNAAVINCPAAP